MKEMYFRQCGAFESTPHYKKTIFSIKIDVDRLAWRLSRVDEKYKSFTAINHPKNNNVYKKMISNVIKFINYVKMRLLLYQLSSKFLNHA